MDSFTEVSSQSWFSRIGESIKSVLIGFVFFIAAFPVLWINEGCSFNTQAGLDELGKVVVTVPSDTVNSEFDKKPVHLIAKATTDETLTDEQFDVSVGAIKLNRRVEMYQWEEEKEEEEVKRTGGSTETRTTYEYHKVWSEGRNDSSSFKHSQGHENPEQLVNSHEHVAQKVTFGAFRLSPSLIGDLDNYENYPVAAASEKPSPEKANPPPAEDPGKPSADDSTNPSKDKPDQPSDDKPDTDADDTSSAQPDDADDNADTSARNSLDKMKPYQDGYYIGDNPENPQVGDLRITFQVLKPTVASVIAQQYGDTFEQWNSPKYDFTEERLMVGEHSSEAMIQTLKSEAAMFTWIVRFGGFIMMTMGIGLVFRPLVVLADVLPILGDMMQGGIMLFAGIVGAALSLTTIGVAWLAYRPLYGILILVVAVGLVVGLKMLLSGRGSKSAA